MKPESVIGLVQRCYDVKTKASPTHFRGSRSGASCFFLALCVLCIHTYVCMDCSPCWAVRPLRVFLYIYIPYRSIHRRRLCPVGWCPSVGRLVVPFPFCHAITSRRTYNPERSVLATVKGQEMGSDDGGGSLVVGLHTPQQQRKSPSPTPVR